MTDGPVYKGRRWLLATRNTQLWPVVAWGLRRSSVSRAMIPPFLGSVLTVVSAFHLLRASAAGIVHPAIGVSVTLLILWPLALALAVGMDLMKKEYRLRTYLRSVQRSGDATDEPG